MVKIKSTGPVVIELGFGTEIVLADQTLQFAFFPKRDKRYRYFRITIGI